MTLLYLRSELENPKCEALKIEKYSRLRMSTSVEGALLCWFVDVHFDRMRMMGYSPSTVFELRILV